MTPETVLAVNQLATDRQNVHFEMEKDDLCLESCDECCLQGTEPHLGLQRALENIVRLRSASHTGQDFRYMTSF